MSDTGPRPADQVERRPIDSLVPYARHARTHSDEQIAQLAGVGARRLLAHEQLSAIAETLDPDELKGPPAS